jgi:tRNA pseudouridine38-40 synthase
MERVIGNLVHEAVELTCAGRTDAGVHARGQVAHADLPADAALTAERINRALPDDIRVTQLTEVSTDFDARFSAIWRTYSYTVCDGIGDPIDRRQVLQWNRPLDVDRMNAAAEAFVGEHDFAGFCKQREGATTVRRILHLRWERRASLAIMHIQADAFCHSMVRSVVGALLPVGDGRQSPAWAAAGIVERNRQPGVTVMPPHALVLEEVGYPPAGQWAARQQQTRQRRDASD